MITIEQLIEVFSFHYPYFEDEDIKKYLHLFELKQFKKGDIIVSNKGVCKTCHFLYSGFVRCYTSEGENENTLWFGEKGDLITSFDSLFDDKQGDDIIVAITDCTTFSINTAEFKKLTRTNTDFNQFYIKIIEAGYQFWENRFRILSQLDVEKRYLEWKGRTKHLEAHVSLGIIAQYLNINQATLSRLRSKLK